MVTDYENGVFIERNDSKKISPQTLFAQTPSFNNLNGTVNYLYDVRKVEENKYAATQVALYSSLRQETQGEKNGVIVFCRIVYDEKDFGKPWSFVKLQSVEGGVVRNNDLYWCEFLYMRYKVRGMGYNADGTKAGFHAKETNYSDTGQIMSPKVGFAYSISGPNDYYYSMGELDGLIVGFLKSHISYRLSTSEELEISSALQAI